jgi:hypothetical protein
MGCYADLEGYGRDLSGLGLTLTNTVGGGSIKTCIAYCLSRNFLFAGVQNGLKFEFYLIAV